MDDAELINEFIRQEVVGDAIHLLVCQIIWDISHTPRRKWKIAARIPRHHPRERLEAAIAQILHNRRYFGLCKECDARQPQGWMLTGDLCQECASTKHGVVL